MKAIASFQGKLATAIKAELDAIRNGVPGVTLGRTISFTEYCELALSAPMPKVLHELGVNLSAMTVAQLVQSETGINWLYPEAVAAAVYDGFVTGQWETAFLAADVPVSSTEVRQPNFTLAPTAGPHDTQEGEEMKVSWIVKGSRAVHIRKLAEAVELNYESVQFATVAQVMVWMKQYGVNLSMQRKAYLADRMVNGDQADGSMAAAVIGVRSVADGFTWRDFTGLCARLGLLGFPVSGVVCDEDAFGALADIDEFKRLAVGTPLTVLKPVTPLPAQLDVGIHTGVGAGRFCFNCQSAGVYQGTAIPFRVEEDTDIKRQIHIKAASLTADMINVNRAGRVIVDPSLDLAANPFPAWMTPNY